MWCDGWEYATGYEWLMKHAEAGTVGIVLATVRDADDDLAAFWCAVTRPLASVLLHPEERVRISGLARLTEQATLNAHRFIEGA